METIIATAFGRVVNIQGGEHDELTKAIEAFFQETKEGDDNSFRYLYPLTSKLL